MLPKISALRAVFIVSFSLIGACGHGREDSTPEENHATTWADADIGLSPTDEPYQLVLQEYPPVNNRDSRQRFSLFAVRKSQGNEGERKQVYYADWSDSSHVATLSYTFRLEVESVGNDVYDLSFLLFKPGVSHGNAPTTSTANSKRIYIGRTQLQSRIGLVQASQSHPFSLAYAFGKPSFVGAGEVVVHYMSQPRFETPSLTVMPLATFCNGSILTPQCKPALLSGLEADGFARKGEVKGADKLEGGTFLLKSGRRAPKTAEVTFVAASVPASDTDNQQRCADLVGILRVSAHDGRENPACRIKLEPSATAKEGKLACRFSVGFDQPADLSEYACNLTAVFSGEAKEIQSVQILYQDELQTD